MIYSQTIDNCLADAIGPAGLADSELAAMLARTDGALAQLRDWKRDGGLPLLDLPAARDDLAALAPVAARYRENFSDVVILGTGGSSLGGRSLYALADRGFGPPAGSPRLHFMDNVDPDSFAAMFAALDPARTGILSISKSGGTAETLSQTMLCMAWLRRAGRRFADHVTIISEDADNALRRLAAKHGLPALTHDPGVGGRYAVLSLVGMLPALIIGQDAAAIREGAAAVLDATLAAARPCDSAPAVGAAVSVALAVERNVAATVLMPYCDRLVCFASWFRQLWAESLGKEGRGTVPIDAAGTVDQHSQLQLYLGGPNDKMFTIIRGPGGGDALDGALADDPSLDYLAGRSLGDLLNACEQGTADSLAAKGRPVRLMEVEAVDERTLGALMMHFMLETIIAAHLLGVNPFDQPEVEDGKQRARAYLEAMAPS
ncbi:MAG: glucose-6-phosphate isomerase [Alphaproteobacteria bacterium]